MYPIPTLEFIGKLSPGRMLDVGSRDFSGAARFASFGYTVDAIDPEPSHDTAPPSGVSFTQTTLEDFKTEQTYDLIIARLVSNFVSYSPKAFISRLNSLIHDDGVIYVTLIGDEDDWAADPSANAVSFDTALEIISGEGLTPLHRSIYWEKGPTYSGELKNWHLFAFALVRTGPTP